jgi:hypothetical protein
MYQIDKETMDIIRKKISELSVAIENQCSYTARERYEENEQFLNKLYELKEV